MYVPPYQSILRSLKTTNSTARDDAGITIPLGLFKMLLQIAVANSDFDEDLYFKKNPDVRDAVSRGDIDSGHVHYIGFGYFEGREGGTALDETWYLEKYPDVAAAVRDGLIPSASRHFLLVGGGEGRSPNAAEEADAAQWKRVLTSGKN